MFHWMPLHTMSTWYHTKFVNCFQLLSTVCQIVDDIKEHSSIKCALKMLWKFNFSTTTTKIQFRTDFYWHLTILLIEVFHWDVQRIPRILHIYRSLELRRVYVCVYQISIRLRKFVDSKKSKRRRRTKTIQSWSVWSELCDVHNNNKKH